MTCSTPFRLSRASLLSAAAAMTVFLGTPGNAQKLESKGPPPSDPIQQWAEQLAPRNQFFIDNDDDVEIIRFKTPHDLELCAARGHTSADGYVRGYPIKAKWDTDSATITPGNCLAIDAMRVSVRSASPLPEDVVLNGTVRVIR